MNRKTVNIIRIGRRFIKKGGVAEKSVYNRPDGTSLYKRPDGTSEYNRP